MREQLDEQRVQQCWKNIPQSTLRALVDKRWVQRVRDVFEHDGDNNFRSEKQQN